MYAIRSYYVVFHFPAFSIVIQIDRLVPGDVFDPENFPYGLRQFYFDNISQFRITSYNVCYTKLLRRISKERVLNMPEHPVDSLINMVFLFAVDEFWIV